MGWVATVNFSQCVGEQKSLQEVDVKNKIGLSRINVSVWLVRSQWGLMMQLSIVRVYDSNYSN